MAEKLPLVYVDGGLSQLPPGDSIEGVQLGTLTAGSGLVGGGDLNTGNKRLDVALASNASGVIFVGDAIGLDGVAEATATAALASGNAGLVLGETALSSGVVAQGEAATALASGNAALEAAVNFVGSSSLELTAASPISIGSAVGLDDTGSVQSVRSVTVDNSNPMSFPSPAVNLGSNYASWLTSSYDSTNNKVVVSFRDDSNSDYGTAVVGTVSGTSISFGSRVVFESAAVYWLSSAYDASNNRIVIAYEDRGNSSYGTAVVGTVSGTSISFGTPVVYETAWVQGVSCVYDAVNNKIVIFYSDLGNGNYGTGVVGTVSGSSISFGTPTVFRSAVVSALSAVHLPSTSKTAISYKDDGNSSYGTVVVAVVSGTSFTTGGLNVYNSANTLYTSAAYDTTNDRLVVSYNDVSTGEGRVVVGVVSGTSVSFGSSVTFGSMGPNSTSIAYDSFSNRVVVAYDDGSGTAIVGTVSGTSISFGSAAVFESNSCRFIRTVFDSTNNKIVISYQETTSSSDAFSIVPDTIYSTTINPLITSQTNFLGIAQATVASGADVNVLLPRAIDTNQTGLTPGYFYYVDAATSGFTTASGQPTAWSGAYNWGPVAKAVSSSGLLLLNPL